MSSFSRDQNDSPKQNMPGTESIVLVPLPAFTTITPEQAMTEAVRGTTADQNITYDPHRIKSTGGAR